MPTEKDHLLQARHNEQLANLLAQDMVYRDWVITTAFYAAVHYVEATFAKRFGLHGEVHGEPIPHVWRLKLLNDRAKFTFTCFRAYRHLYTSSRRVRYLETGQPKGADLDDKTMSGIRDDLATVKKELKY